MSLDAFVNWLAESPLSIAIGGHNWVTPAVQTVHILAIAAIMAGVLMTDLKALGAVGRGEPMLRFTRRYGPSALVALFIALVSGSTLIIGEPARSLQNPIFVLKMALLLSALVLTAAIHGPILRDESFWTGRTLALRGLAGLSLLIWMSIIFAGRWIAYAVT